MKINVMKSMLMLFTLSLMGSNVFAQNNDRPPRERPSIDQLFKDLDTNEDKKLSLKEVKGPLKTHFKKIDLNEDGFLTREEIEKAPKPKGRKQDQE